MKLIEPLDLGSSIKHKISISCPGDIELNHAAQTVYDFANVGMLDCLWFYEREANPTKRCWLGKFVLCWRALMRRGVSGEILLCRIRRVDS